MANEIIYGLNPVLEALRAGKRRCHGIFIAAGRREADARLVEEEAARRRIPVKALPREEIAQMAGAKTHQGVVAKIDPYPYDPLGAAVDAALADARKGFLLVLDGITDPQNLGSIIRTAHLMGVHGVILPRDNAAGVTPTVVKASAGASEHTRIVQVTNIAETLRYIKERGFWVSGAAGEGSESLYDHDFTGENAAIVLGEEGGGIRRLVRERCDYLLRIPMEGVVGSYNVSVAGALFMGEVARQRLVKR